jgi:hypothetical protein
LNASDWKKEGTKDTKDAKKSLDLGEDLAAGGALLRQRRVGSNGEIQRN